MPSSFDPNRYGNPYATRKPADRTPEKLTQSVTTTIRHTGRDASRSSGDKPMPASLVSTQMQSEEHKALQPSDVQREQETKLSSNSPNMTKSTSPQVLPSALPSTGKRTSNHQDVGNKEKNIKHRKKDHYGYTSHQEPMTSDIHTTSTSLSVPKTTMSDPKAPATAKSVPSLDAQQMLSKVKSEILKHITVRNRFREQDGTTALGDLNLARRSTPVKRSTSFKSVGGSEGIGISDGFKYVSNRGTTQSNASQHFSRLEQRNEPTQAHRTIESSLQHHDDTVSHRLSMVSNTMKVSGEDDEDAQSSQLQQSLDSRNSRWASKVDLKPIGADMDGGSDVSSSPIRSDATQASGDSLVRLHEGHPCLNDHRPAVAIPLVGYDGRWQPPPVDWDDRPRFDNSAPVFRDTFRHWVQDIVERTTDPSAEMIARPLSRKTLQNLDMYPDGIAMVPRDLLIDKSNAAAYGYADIEDVTRYVQPMEVDDFEDWGKLDDNRPENYNHKDETTWDLIRTWRRNTNKRRAIQKIRAETKQKSKALKHVYKSEIEIREPEINIYLRPAVRCDIPQMTEIYNQYIVSGCRPAEIDPINNTDMRDRLLDARSSSLPFLVAVLRNKTSMISPKSHPELALYQGSSHHENKTELTDEMMKGLERVVGWAAAQDFTASDFVERISVEMEIYVKPEYRQKGVGRCLMDQMLEALDRGYVKKGGYLFTCAQEMRHIYSPGGGRDIHKILVVIRKYRFPLQPALLQRQLKDNQQDNKINDREDDFDHWIKAWFEENGFQLEGVLSSIGVKWGRFLDVAYMGKETMWQPGEGKIPDPQPSV